MFVTAIVFFIILSLLVLVHELGHFLVARWVGVRVEEFGFGLPPRIWGKKIKGTIYSLNWLPIGGFVKLAGEDEMDEPGKKYHKWISPGRAVTEPSWDFRSKSKKERAAILSAGVTMNFLLAIGVTSYLLNQGVLEPKPRVHIEEVLPGSPAQALDLKAQDIVTEVGFVSAGRSLTRKITEPQDLINIAKAHAGEPITLYVLRQGQLLNFIITPRKTFPKGQGPIGVAISNLETTKYSLLNAPVQAVKINLSRAWLMLTSLVGFIWGLIQLKPISSDVAGPIGIAAVTGQAVKYGLTAVLEFVSILSLNLAVLNVLPFPALDGGRLAFVFLEKIFGRKIRPVFERRTHEIGMIILLILILLISIHDIFRLASGSLGGG